MLEVLTFTGSLFVTDKDTVGTILELTLVALVVKLLQTKDHVNWLALPI